MLCSISTCPVGALGTGTACNSGPCACAGCMGSLHSFGGYCHHSGYLSSSCWCLVSILHSSGTVYW